MSVFNPRSREICIGMPQTFQAEHGASESTTDRAVVRVVLLSQVCCGVLGEHVRSTHSGCASSQSRSISQCVLFKSFLRHTENANGASRPGEDTPCADILLCEGVLDGGDEGARAAGHQRGLDGVAQSILGVVFVGMLVQFSHGCGCCEWRG